MKEKCPQGVCSGEGDYITHLTCSYGSYLITLGPLNSWLAKNVSRTLMVSNGLVNTVGVNLTHRPMNRFTFSGRRITFFAPARLVDSCSSQAVEFSTAITRFNYQLLKIIKNNKERIYLFI